MADRVAMDEQKGRVQKPEIRQEHSADNPAAASPITNLQRKVGNRAVQRLLAQRSGGDGSFELDDQVASRINSERSSGQPLDAQVQESMGAQLGYDFSDVKVHTSPESHNLNRALDAEAFTTGHDVFFREGAYQPGSTSGQQLLAHELTHVVQQGTGEVPSTGNMTVNAPGDTFEQEADRTASNLSSANPGVQRQSVPDEEEEETAMPKRLQRQEVPEEEEEVQTKRLQRQSVPDEEEEETAMPKRLQRQEVPEEEEEVQTKRLQRQSVPDEEEEETAMPKRLQRDPIPEDETGRNG
ncbi:MAG TPA: DUF4157 domain-containing protein [Anaerolineaceae bacterium]